MARTKQTARKVPKEEGEEKTKQQTQKEKANKEKEDKPKPQTQREKSRKEQQDIPNPKTQNKQQEKTNPQKEKGKQEDKTKQQATKQTKEKVEKDKVPKQQAPLKEKEKDKEQESKKEQDQSEKGPEKKKSRRKPAKPTQLKPLLTKRRFSQGVKCLREIRKAMKALSLAVPRLPFQRLCRQIAEEYRIDCRWTRTALGCIHEASEDFLVELFQDAYICAAHAHRVTLMDKDVITLRRLRYRFSKMLEPLPMQDEKAWKILNIPPWRKPKEPDVKVEDVTEEQDKKGKKKEQQLKQEDTRIAEREELNQIEAELVPIVLSINPTGFLVSLFIEEDQREDYITLDAESIIIIKDWTREINDSIVLCAMRFVLPI